MRKVILYIASSLDGKIAKPDGDVKWLDQMPNPEKTDYGYSAFYNSVDTTLMGRTTYDHIKHYGFEYYKNTKNYVFSSKEAQPHAHMEFISQKATSFVKRLKYKPGEHIWLIGGGKLNTSLLEAQLIDEMILFVMPIVLGAGIPLFGVPCESQMVELMDTKIYKNGVVMHHYRF